MAKEVSVAAIDEKIEDLVIVHNMLAKSLQKKLGLTASAVAILELLNKDRLSLKELTERSILDKSTLSRQVNQLVKIELVQREVGKDKRYVKFSATEKGHHLLEEYTQEKNKKLDSVLISWTEEEKQLLLILLGRIGRSINQSI